MRVLFVASECYPYVKTGGLADVVAALPPALRRLGLDVRTLLPGFPGVLDRLEQFRRVRLLRDLPGLASGQTARLLSACGTDGVPLYILDAPSLFAREGNPYLGPDGRDWPDNALRYAALARAAALLARDGDGLITGRTSAATAADGRGWVPQILHGHDWQAGLLPVYAASLMPEVRPASVFTIHNLAFQGLFPPEMLGPLGLDPALMVPDGFEFYGKVGFMKAGLRFADRLTTVSPTYAAEIRGPELGFGLDGLLRQRADRLTGILNGVDLEQWNPATDSLITARYDAGTLDDKASNKLALQQRFGLRPDAAAPLFAVVSRLTEQKGIDLIVQCLPSILTGGGQLVVLGTGDPTLEAALAGAAGQSPDCCGLVRAYDEELSHLIQAGADLLLVPSRFEPCGLTQMYALRYGTLPLVSQVGGLADTVTDVTEASLADNSATGFVFSPVGAQPLQFAIDQALALWRRPALWRQVQRNGMGCDLGWAGSAARYAALYQELTGRPPRRRPSRPEGS